MIWSKYNYLYKSKQYGKCFLYNSRTNSFISLSPSLFKQLSVIKKSHQQELAIDALEDDIKRKLIKAKVFSSKFEDESFITQKKLIKYNQSFQEKELGIVLLPTFACNFQCPYCYESNLPSVFMDEETEDQIIQFIKKNKGSDRLHLCWHGGEPLLAFKNIKRILEKIESEGTIKIKNHSMVSNGYLLDKTKCLLLKRYNLNTIQISIDGLREQHNKSRIHKNGTPTFDIILNNVENIFRIIPKCHVIIRMNTHIENEEDFPLLYEMLTKRWGNQNYSVQMKYVNKHNSGCKIECIKNKNQALHLQKLYRKYNFNNTDLFPSPQIGGCVATQINSFVIGTKGEIYKCWVDVGKKDRVVGNIFSNEYNMTLISEYILGTDMFNDKKCLKCILLPICDGGCNLQRLEHKISGKNFDNCPVDTKKLDMLLDMLYEIKHCK